MNRKNVVSAVATLDTKGLEAAYVAERLAEAGVEVVIVDVGTRGAPMSTHCVNREVVAANHPDGANAVLGLTDRGRAVEAMSIAPRGLLRSQFDGTAADGKSDHKAGGGVHDSSPGEGRMNRWLLLVSVAVALEPGRGRVFVSIPGHYSWTFADPLFRVLLLRGIAWSAKEPVDRFNDLVWPGADVVK